jgi:hypothetical protein
VPENNPNLATVSQKPFAILKQCGLHVGKKIHKYKTFCEISSSHGGEYDVQSCLLGCTAV